MYLTLERRLRTAVQEHLHRTYKIELSQLVVDQPPKSEMGDFALPFCFELARQLRRAPRQIAQEIVDSFLLPAGFAKVEVAGGGYLNFYVDRGALLAGLAARDEALEPAFDGKVVVEHTNINPNKAAHIGHLRNAVLGDSFVRLLRRRGEPVEVQNYIDNTGVQVADVVVAFEHMLGVQPEQVEADIQQKDELRSRLQAEGQLSPPPQYLPLHSTDPSALRQSFSFDYECWDLYARASKEYDEHPASIALRRDTLHAIEHGHEPTAHLAEHLASAIVRAHLRTMERLNVRYDVLPRESEILHLHFWETAFQLLKGRGAIRYETEGKNAGCWVMDPKKEEGAKVAVTDGASPHDETKVIVRSNGTVTYVGKDIAYQLWKFGLLGRDFGYAPFRTYPAAKEKSAQIVWTTTTEGAPLPGETTTGAHPTFGHAARVFNVIDVRQSYLQDIVTAGLRALGYNDEADRSVHFSYEMVALTPRCAEQLGYTLTEEDRKRPYVEVSGRKGFGIKADDLLDQLILRALNEVEKRHPQRTREEQLALATPIAIGALRYFLLKYTTTAVIAFDFDEALSFEGETGPYVQYAAVRAGNILKKAIETLSGDAAAVAIADENRPLHFDEAWGRFLATDHGLWDLVWLAARLDATVGQALITLEPSCIAKYAFQLAQTFSNFYHKYPVLPEPDGERRRFLLALVRLLRQQLTTALDLMGVHVPEAM